MSEENSADDFKAIRITLSQEAFDRMEIIMKDAKFRSYSATIEECLRTVYDLMQDIYFLTGDRDSPTCHPDTEDWIKTLEKVIIRMYRITGRTVLTKAEVERQSKRSESATKER
ncbi:MAG: hypothetical protein ABSA79_12600 [Candidatus Bathyarchaeia archaeon]